MNNLRRFISFTILLTAPLALYAGRDAATSASHTEYRAYVGNYTTKTDSKGIYRKGRGGRKDWFAFQITRSPDHPIFKRLL